MFSNGKYGETEGQGHKDYPSPAYGKIYAALGATFGKPEMRIRVPIKAFTNTTKVAAQDTTFLDPLYDTNIQVQWQPFGETKDMLNIIHQRLHCITLPRLFLKIIQKNFLLILCLDKLVTIKKTVIKM